MGERNAHTWANVCKQPHMMFSQNNSYTKLTTKTVLGFIITAVTTVLFAMCVIHIQFAAIQKLSPFNLFDSQCNK